MLFLENLISGTLPFCFLVISGLYLTIKTGFCQFRCFFSSVSLTVKAFKNRESGNEITSFKSACTALSSTVGTGNIAGVANALCIGGPGAIFWMWISAVLGMCIKAVEISLAVKYREKTGKQFVGGPMYYIKNGLGEKFKILSFVFAIAALPAVFCSGNITQTNAAITSFCYNDFSKIIWGIIFCIAVFLSICGSLKKIADLTERIVPVMSVLYILLCTFVLIRNFETLPNAFYVIFKGAFNPKAVTGGMVGSFTGCVFIGASRGIFSNEAGLGTSAMAHSVAIDANSHTQGLFGILEVFIDTILLCTLTALTILCSGVKINYGSNASSELVAQVLSKNYNDFGNIALSVMLCLFAFSSIIGWGFYGKLCWNFLFGRQGNIVFTLTYPLCCILGSLFGSSIAWRTASFCNGVMLCTNLIAIMFLYSKLTICKKRKGIESDSKENTEHTRNFSVT